MTVCGSDDLMQQAERFVYLHQADLNCVARSDALRLFCVFKCESLCHISSFTSFVLGNAFEGGIYPHVARINHSCIPNCRYRYKNGRIEVWARQTIPAGAELSISYRFELHVISVCDTVLCGRSCQTAFPGMPWDVYLNRQRVLKANYFFDCNCELCSATSVELESMVCRMKGCRGFVKPLPDKPTCMCTICGTSRECVEIWADGAELMTQIRAMEDSFEQTGRHSVEAATEMVLTAQKLLEATLTNMHPNHIAVYRLQAMVVSFALHVKSSKDATYFDDQFALRGFDVLVGDCLNNMDASAVVGFGGEDLMRLTILKVMDAVVLHRQVKGGVFSEECDSIRQQIEQSKTSIQQAHNHIFCSNCEKQSACSLDLFACGRCRAVQYCSKECQRTHWKTGGHRKLCR